MNIGSPFFDKLEHSLRLLALSLLLAFQGMVSVGAVDRFDQSAFLAPDGTVATAGDICNNSGSSVHTTCQHCPGCFALPFMVPPPAFQPGLSVNHPEKPTAITAAAPLSRPEAGFKARRAPPLS